MSFDLERILASKRAFRQRLAARPIEEKLSMLDALRKRTLALRPLRPASETGAMHEEPPPYRVSERNQDAGQHE
jgi:hypothetical protein